MADTPIKSNLDHFGFNVRCQMENGREPEADVMTSDNEGTTPHDHEALCGGQKYTLKHTGVKTEAVAEVGGDEITIKTDQSVKDLVISSPRNFSSSGVWYHPLKPTALVLEQGFTIPWSTWSEGSLPGHDEERRVGEETTPATRKCVEPHEINTAGMTEEEAREAKEQYGCSKWEDTPEQTIPIMETFHIEGEEPFQYLQTVTALARFNPLTQWLPQDNRFRNLSLEVGLVGGLGRSVADQNILSGVILGFLGRVGVPIVRTDKASLSGGVEAGCQTAPGFGDLGCSAGLYISGAYGLSPELDKWEVTGGSGLSTQGISPVRFGVTYRLDTDKAEILETKEKATSLKSSATEVSKGADAEFGRFEKLLETLGKLRETLDKAEIKRTDPSVPKFSEFETKIIALAEIITKAKDLKASVDATLDGSGDKLRDIQTYKALTEKVEELKKVLYSELSESRTYALPEGQTSKKLLKGAEDLVDAATRDVAAAVEKKVAEERQRAEAEQRAEQERIQKLAVAIPEQTKSVAVEASQQPGQAEQPVPAVAHQPQPAPATAQPQPLPVQQPPAVTVAAATAVPAASQSDTAKREFEQSVQAYFQISESGDYGNAWASSNIETKFNPVKDDVTIAKRFNIYKELDSYKDKLVALEVPNKTPTDAELGIFEEMRKFVASQSLSKTDSQPILDHIHKIEARIAGIYEKRFMDLFNSALVKINGGSALEDAEFSRLENAGRLAKKIINNAAIEGDNTRDRVLALDIYKTFVAHLNALVKSINTTPLTKTTIDGMNANFGRLKDYLPNVLRYVVGNEKSYTDFVGRFETRIKEKAESFNASGENQGAQAPTGPATAVPAQPTIIEVPPAVEVGGAPVTKHKKIYDGAFNKLFDKLVTTKASLTDEELNLLDDLVAQITGISGVAPTSNSKNLFIRALNDLFKVYYAPGTIVDGNLIPTKKSEVETKLQAVKKIVDDKLVDLGVDIDRIGIKDIEAMIKKPQPKPQDPQAPAAAGAATKPPPASVVIAPQTGVATAPAVEVVNPAADANAQGNLVVTSIRPFIIGYYDNYYKGKIQVDEKQIGKIEELIGKLNAATEASKKADPDNFVIFESTKMLYLDILEKVLKSGVRVEQQMFFASDTAPGSSKIDTHLDNLVGLTRNEDVRKDPDLLAGIEKLRLAVDDRNNVIEYKKSIAHNFRKFFNVGTFDSTKELTGREVNTEGKPAQLLRLIQRPGSTIPTQEIATLEKCNEFITKLNDFVGEYFGANSSNTAGLFKKDVASSLSQKLSRLRALWASLPKELITVGFLDKYEPKIIGSEKDGSDKLRQVALQGRTEPPAIPATQSVESAAIELTAKLGDLIEWGGGKVGYDRVKVLSAFKEQLETVRRAGGNETNVPHFKWFEAIAKFYQLRLDSLDAQKQNIGSDATAFNMIYNTYKDPHGDFVSMIDVITKEDFTSGEPEKIIADNAIIYFEELSTAVYLQAIKVRREYLTTDKGIADKDFQLAYLISPTGLNLPNEADLVRHGAKYLTDKTIVELPNFYSVDQLGKRNFNKFIEEVPYAFGPNAKIVIFVKGKEKEGRALKLQYDDANLFSTIVQTALVADENVTVEKVYARIYRDEAAMKADVAKETARSVPAVSAVAGTPEKIIAPKKIETISGEEPSRQKVSEILKENMRSIAGRLQDELRSGRIKAKKYDLIIKTDAYGVVSVKLIAEDTDFTTKYVRIGIENRLTSIFNSVRLEPNKQFQGFPIVLTRS